MADLKLLSCPNPWCGITNRRLMHRHSETYEMQVACDCGVSSPYRNTREEALAAWNNRPTDTINERVAVLTAHRACCGTEHDPANGKLHGCCIVCGVPWPCEYAGTPTFDPRIAAAQSLADALKDANAYLTSYSRRPMFGTECDSDVQKAHNAVREALAAWEKAVRQMTKFVESITKPDSTLAPWED